jgi:hypothetical protein
MIAFDVSHSSKHLKDARSNEQTAIVDNDGIP